MKIVLCRINDNSNERLAGGGRRARAVGPAKGMNGGSGKREGDLASTGEADGAAPSGFAAGWVRGASSTGRKTRRGGDSRPNRSGVHAGESGLRTRPYRTSRSILITYQAHPSYGHETPSTSMARRGPRIDVRAAGYVVAWTPDPWFPAAASRKMRFVRNQEKHCGPRVLAGKRPGGTRGGSQRRRSSPHGAAPAYTSRSSRSALAGPRAATAYRRYRSRARRPGRGGSAKYWNPSRTTRAATVARGCMMALRYEKQAMRR